MAEENEDRFRVVGGWATIAFGSAALAGIVFAFVHWLLMFNTPPIAAQETHEELVEILLTGLTISLAVLGLLVAGLAIWGYHAIQDRSKKIARKAAVAAAKQAVTEPPVLSILVEEAKTILAREFDEWRESQKMAQSQPPQDSSKIVIGSGEEQAIAQRRRPRKEAGK